MDAPTALHFKTWLDREYDADKHTPIIDSVLDFLQDYPDMIDRKTWPEIVHLATRRI